MSGDHIWMRIEWKLPLKRDFSPFMPLDVASLVIEYYHCSVSFECVGLINQQRYMHLQHITMCAHRIGLLRLRYSVESTDDLRVYNLLTRQSPPDNDRRWQEIVRLKPEYNNGDMKQADLAFKSIQDELHDHNVMTEVTRKFVIPTHKAWNTTTQVELRKKIKDIQKRSAAEILAIKKRDNRRMNDLKQELSNLTDRETQLWSEWKDDSTLIQASTSAPTSFDTFSSSSSSSSSTLSSSLVAASSLSSSLVAASSLSSSLVASLQKNIHSIRKRKFETDAINTKSHSENMFAFPSK